MHSPDSCYNILIPSVIIGMARGTQKCQHKVFEAFFYLIKKDHLQTLCCLNPSPCLLISWRWLSTCWGRGQMAATEGKRAIVPCSTHEEDRCFEQERFGSRGKIPLFEICNILSRGTKHSPQFLCRKNAGKQSVQHPSSSVDCAELNFTHWVENSDQKVPPFLKLASANASTDGWHASPSLHKQKLHHMCTASSCSSQVQHQKAGSLFFKMLAPVTVKSPRNAPSKRAEEICDPADLLSLV